MEIEKNLYEASLEGSVPTLESLTKQDPLILDRVLPTFFHETPLHIATLRGHHDFARALLSHNPKLATETDSLGNSPLHVASAKGHAAIARELIHAGPTTCLGRNRDGRLPLHLAVMRGGRVDLVRELTRACPESTRVRLDRGETVFHLCVKYGNLEALQVLVDELVDEIDSNSLVNARDDDGNTILHTAALHKDLEIIEYLLTRPGTELNATNNNGLTALDLVENSPKDMKTLQVLNLLLEYSNAQRTNNNNKYPSTLKTKNKTPPPPIVALGDNPRSKTRRWKRFFTFTDDNSNRLEEIRGELLIISAIIVAIITLPIINMKVIGPVVDDELTTGTLSLVPALSIMVLLVSGFSLSNKFCVWLMVQLLYTTLGFLGLYYFGSIVSNESRYFEINTMVVLMCIWFGLLVMVSLLNMIRLVVWLGTCIKGCLRRRKLRGRN